MSDIKKQFQAKLKKADDTQRAVEFLQTKLPGMSLSFSGSGASSIYFDVTLNGETIGTLNVNRQFISDSIWQPSDY